MWKPNPARRGPSLVEECEAFLNGHYGDLMTSNGQWSPPWAWLNRLAHRPPPEVESMAADEMDGVDPLSPAARWAQATSFLATELLQAAHGDPDEVERLQLEALVPIELRWISDIFSPHTPHDFVTEVIDELVKADHGGGWRP